MTSAPATPSPYVTRLEGPAPEAGISKDLIRRGLMVAPIAIAVFGVIWGLNGALSCAYGLALVLVNFAAAAALVSTTARISLGLMMGAALFGYLIRLSLIFLAVYLVRDAGWVELLPLGITIIVAHLGLLAWEFKYVSATLAFPGLKPSDDSSRSLT
jgi:hypothetical protein